MAGSALVDEALMRTDPRVRRGVVWQRSGSRDLSHRVHDTLDQIGGDGWL